MSDARDAKRYERLKITVRLVNLGLTIIYAGALALLADRIEPALEAVTASRWLGLLLFGGAFFLGMEIVTLPLGFYSEFRIEHAFGLSNQTVRGWIEHTLKEWLVGLILGAILIGGLYAALWYGGARWWLWVWLGWQALSVGLAKLFPVLILPLFYKSEPVESPSLHDRFRRIAEGTALTIHGIFRLGLSKDTKKANAMLAGLGTTRRVYLADTLLDAFAEEEIGIVFAHELTHHVRGHIVKGIAMSAVMSTIVVAAVAAVLAPYAGTSPALWPGAVVRLPLVGLTVMAVSFALMPITNAILRRFERECDLGALDRTADPAAYRSAMTKLGQMNLADAEPARWIELLFHDHPALAKRIALADRWEAAKQVTP